MWARGQMLWTASRQSGHQPWQDRVWAPSGSGGVFGWYLPPANRALRVHKSAKKEFSSAVAPGSCGLKDELLKWGRVWTCFGCHMVWQRQIWKGGKLG